MIEESGNYYKKITNSIKRKFFKKNMRYEYLIDIIEYLEPKSIIEIGVAEGKNAEEMLRKTGNGTKYTGYDVFDFTDKIFHNLVGY